jgi:hypothetical protein
MQPTANRPAAVAATATNLLDLIGEAREPTPWLAEGLIVESELVMIHGPSHAGNTYLALDLALAVSLGHRTHHGFDLPGEPRPVVYVATEGKKGISRRVGSWLGVYRPDLIPSFTVKDLLLAKIDEGGAIPTEDLSGDPPPFYRYDADLFLGEGAEADVQLSSLYTFTERLGDCYGVPPLVVVDVVGDLTPGLEENSIHFKHALRRLHPYEFTGEHPPTVVLVHHEGHTAQGRPRGHSGIIGLVDCLLGVEYKTNETATSPATLAYVKVSSHKQRNGDKARPFILNLEKPTPDLVTPVISGRPAEGVEKILLRSWKRNGGNAAEDSSEVFGEVFRLTPYHSASFGPELVDYVGTVRELAEQSDADGVVLPREVRESLDIPRATEHDRRKKLLDLGFITPNRARDTGNDRGGFVLTPEGVEASE